MVTLGSEKRRVWISGAGVSGTIAALRFLRLGCSVTLWLHPGCTYKAVESTSQEFCYLLRELDADDCVAACGHHTTDGFCCFERSALAECLLKKARNAGAEIRFIGDMPGHWEGRCDALIDATGRSAVWSGPIRRYGREIADIYEFRVAGTHVGRRLIATESFWAYQMATPSLTTAVVITRHGKDITRATQKALRQLNVDPAAVRFVGRRFCSPQWAEKPLEANRISVGDSAFAYYPLAGMGIRFAVATATAAAAVLQTRWQRPQSASIADEYYCELCEAARTSHLVNLTGVQRVARSYESGPLLFTARETQTGVLRGDFVVPEKTYLLPDGSRVRWVGKIDLVDIRQLSLQPIERIVLAERLAHALASDVDVKQLIDWCIRRQVLSPAL